MSIERQQLALKFKLTISTSLKHASNFQCLFKYIIGSLRFKIVVMLGMVGNVKGTCIFVFKSNGSFWSSFHLHNLKYSHISFETI